MGGGGGGEPFLYLLPPVKQAGERVAAGYAVRIVHLHCPKNVSFSFSTFLRLAASWTGVDKKLFALAVQNKKSFWKAKMWFFYVLVNFFAPGSGSTTLIDAELCTVEKC